MDKLTGRQFRIWDYSVSFSRLLIRSPRNISLGFEHNLDIIFWGVEHMDVGIHLHDISITEEEYDKSDRRFIIKSKQGEFVIIAHSYIIRESYTHIFHSPLDTI